MMTIHDQLLTFAVVALVFYFILQKGLRRKTLALGIFMGLISGVGQFMAGERILVCFFDGTISAMVWYSMVAGVRILLSEKEVSLSPKQKGA